MKERMGEGKYETWKDGRRKKRKKRWENERKKKKMGEGRKEKKKMGEGRKERKDERRKL